MIGDGDPTEWGYIRADGWRVHHPPWGPVEVGPGRRVSFVPYRSPWGPELVVPSRVRPLGWWRRWWARLRW